ncbi:fructosamine kinase family protein [Sphingosinicella sp. BN140058]|uniref:fructosamine kinase family protein n=1 Tax=Sphingosinicella sp. BN140058 TaxID=1892855 RepID=UPI00197E1E9C|nr:fructosamine kinase family protein [Sphingosinicella sp. BN140058]
MSFFARRVATLTGLSEDRLEHLAGGDLSEVLLVRRLDGRISVAKGSPAVGTEATMLRAIAGAGVPAPHVEGELAGVLMIEHVDNDRVFSPSAWRSLGAALRQLHDHLGEAYGWPVDYALGTVSLDNRQGQDWPAFWLDQRLKATAAVLDRPWRERIAAVGPRLAGILPAAPPPSLLHGDLWTGNILVSGGRLAALIDPACYHGHAEVDLAMLTLFDTPDAAFWQAYGSPPEGWPERQAAYQLFPALVHLRLFGGSYGNLVERLLGRIEA